MSVEGMWAFVSGTYEDPEAMRDGGIVVLETNRVFGGDSAMAYVGTYTVDQGKMRAVVRSWTWNTAYAEAGMQNVFGMAGQIDYTAVAEVELRDGDLEGVIYPEAMPTARLPVRFVKISDLP